MHILLVGSGRRAYFLARRFRDLGSDVTTVVSDANEARHLSRALEGVTVVVGDGARPDVLDDAGALYADALVAASADDHRNLVACQMARRAFFVSRTIAVVEDPDNEEVFRRLGVDATVSVTDLLLRMAAREAVSRDVRRLEAFAAGRILVTDLVLPTGAPAVGSTLADIGAARGLVGAVLRDDRAFIPRGDTRLEAGDQLVLITTDESQDAFVEQLVGK
jgi:trk system potassium uptake protein TrkA